MSEINFNEAIEALLNDKRVTRKDWGDKRTYYILKDNLLSIHKAGTAEDVVSPVVLSDLDMLADDWTIL